jgi:hypothetical protein
MVFSFDPTSRLPVSRLPVKFLFFFRDPLQMRRDEAVKAPCTGATRDELRGYSAGNAESLARREALRTNQPLRKIVA